MHRSNPVALLDLPAGRTGPTEIGAAIADRVAPTHARRAEAAG